MTRPLRSASTTCALLFAALNLASLPARADVQQDEGEDLGRPHATPTTSPSTSSSPQGTSGQPSTYGAPTSSVAPSSPTVPRGALATPSTYSVNFAFGGFFSYGALGGGVPAIGGGAEISVRALISPQYSPPVSGGFWHAVAIEPYLQFTGAGVVNGDASGGLFMLNGGGAIGYSLIHLGAMQPDYTQDGWGLYANWRFGVQNTNFAGETSASATDFSHGPTVGFVLPTYKTSSGHLKRGYFNFTVLFVDGAQFFQVGGGTAF